MNKELTGTNIELTNAGERQLSSFQIEGKSVQNGTPEPNVPIEIESVGYENLFDGEFRQGSENYLENTQNIFSKNDLVLQAGTYTFSTNLPMTSFKYTIGTSQTAFPTTATYIGGFHTTSSFTFTINEELHIGILVNGNGVNITPDDIINYHFQITKGTKQHSYIPYGKYGIEVKTTGRNIIPFVDQNFDLKGINYSVKNGSLFLTGTSSGETSSVDNTFKTNFLFTLDAGKYTFSHKTGLVAVYLYDENNNHILMLGKNIASSNFNLSAKTNVYIGFYQYQASFSNVNTEIMISKQSGKYESYQSYTSLIVLNEPLRSLPNEVKDIAYIENNKLYVNRRVSNIVLNGTEPWAINQSSSEYISFYLATEPYKSIMYGRSNFFPNIKVWEQDVSQVNTEALWNHNGASFGIKIANTRLSSEDVTGFKTWLSNNNIEVQYELMTPVVEELGEVNIPTTTYGTNYITTTDPLKPNIILEYFKGFSDEDKQAIKNGTVAIKSRIIVNTEPQMVLTENDSIKDWEYCDERYVPQQGFIGQFVARTLSGNLQDISDDFNIENHEIELQLGIVDIGSGGETWYSFGKFLVTSPEGDEVTDNTKFEAMDYTKKFNVDFDGNYTSENFPESYNAIVAVDETTSEPKGSVTALWLARYTCEQAGVPFGQNTFTNADYIIDFNPYQAGESCRDVIKDIAKLAFSWVRVDVDNKCYIDFKETNVTYEDEYNVFTNDEYYSLETKKEIYGPINRVYIGMSNIDGESIIVAEDKDDIETNGEKALYIYDNQLTYSPELRALIADNHSANKLLGLTYTHLTTETIGHPWLNGKEFISVIGMEDNECKTYPFNRIIKFNGHIKSTIDSMGESEVEATLGYESEVVKNAKNAMVLVKKHEGEIELLTTDVTNVQDNIKDNYYTKEDTNKTILNATSGLTNIYTSAGGNNRFRNTGLHFKEADGFEYWNGLVEVITEINSSTQTAMLLQNGSVSQMVSNLPNGKYTVSFKYEELIESSSAYVLINSTRYDLAGSGKFEQTIDVNTNNIEIDFNCDTNGGFKIYELMGNVGETALVWTQHPDEIMTDTVNISKGITITSSKTDAIFKAGADGIRIENRSKNTTTEFLENGMSTNDAEIKGQAKISGSLFTKVGNQTWISGL